MAISAKCIIRKLHGELHEFDDRMFDLINGYSSFDMLDFPELTKAYLGLCPQPFDEVLRSTPRVFIDLADNLGQTTLHWASVAGDSEAAEQLVRCGSDPNKIDTSGRSSLHLSIYGESRCLELLLRAKADVDLKDVDGRTAMYHLSAYGWETTGLDVLLRYGANIEATTRVGRTPLHAAIIDDNHLMVSGLLERGANINAITSNGWTCLHEALSCHGHNSLRILLNNTGLRYNVELGNGRTLLHSAALYADIESLYTLMSKPLYELDTAQEDVHGWTAMQLAQFRRLKNEKWSRNFVSLATTTPRSGTMCSRSWWRVLLKLKLR